jgi:amidase
VNTGEIVPSQGASVGYAARVTAPRSDPARVYRGREVPRVACCWALPPFAPALSPDLVCASSLAILYHWSLVAQVLDPGSLASVARIVRHVSVGDSLGERIGGSGVAVGGVTVAGLQRALSSGSLTSAELTAFYLERIGRLNPGLHAVITVSPDAQAEARASDGVRAGGRPRGPLEGVPVLVKDNIAARGMPATAGSPALLGAVSADAFLVGRLRAAGAVIVGKANLSEWANFRSPHSTSGWSTLGGQTVNPHGRGRNPSGSSSGSAAALAAGLAPLAIGTETDGSVLSPSSACGVVGLVSRSGVVPVSAAQDTAGPMACCVADVAALLGVIAGPDPADPATAEQGGPVPGYTAFLDAGALDGARVGVWRDGSADAGPATVAVLDAAVTRLRERGGQVIDPVPLPDADKISDPEFTALVHEFKHDLDAYLGALGGDHHPASLAELITFNTEHRSQVLIHFGQEWFERAAATSGSPADPELLAARAEARHLACTALDSALTGHRLDAVVALTGGPAWLTDHVLGDRQMFGTSSPCAVSGYPAISVPAGRVSGLPVGLTFMGPAWSEPKLIALAYAFEQAR